jgi:sulfatase maturation enzyme AslB (radical SAM superfamily)
MRLTNDQERVKMSTTVSRNTVPSLSAPPTANLAHGNAARGKVRLSRAGVHWFDRATGLNILVDEITIPPERWSRAPRYVSIALTNACELRCEFCYAPKVPGRLDANLILSWMLELDAEGCLGVGFGGGEPTAHPQFSWICGQAAERTNLAVTVTTHGHRMDETLAAAIRGSVHFIRVSMDGLGATYEHLRGRSFASFQQHLDVVATIAPFGLNVVVNDRTAGELDAIASFAGHVGAAELLLLPEQPVGGRPGISQGASKQLTEWVSAADLGLRLAISRAGVTDGMPLADPFGEEPQLDSHAHVDARGTLRTHAFACDGVPIGSSILQATVQLRDRINA